MKTTKLLALTAALNLAIIGAGYAYSQATSEHEIATVTQVTSSSPFDVLKLSEVKKEYPDEMAKLEAVVKAETAVDALKKAEEEAAKAKKEHEYWLAKGDYECTEYTATLKKDGSSTEWNKRYSTTWLTWDHKNPANMEMTSKRMSFKFVNMQGYETSYGVPSTDASDGAEYEIELDKLDENRIKVTRLEAVSDGTHNTMWICK